MSETYIYLFQTPSSAFLFNIWVGRRWWSCSTGCMTVPIQGRKNPKKNKRGIRESWQPRSASGYAVTLDLCANNSAYEELIPKGAACWYTWHMSPSCVQYHTCLHIVPRVMAKSHIPPTELLDMNGMSHVWGHIYKHSKHCTFFYEPVTQTLYLSQ